MYCKEDCTRRVPHTFLGGAAFLAGAAALGAAPPAGGEAINPALTYDNAMLNSSMERSYAGTGAMVVYIK
jgi:hypothetical protein